LKEFQGGTLYDLSELTPRQESNVTDVFLSCTVTGASQVEDYPQIVPYKCINCKDVSYDTMFEYEPYIMDRINDWRDLPNKHKCPNCGEFCIQENVTKGQLRKVLLSQQGETNPISLVGYVYGDDINRIQPGTEMRLSGLLRSRKAKPTDLTFKRYFDVSKYTLAEDKPLIPTDEEIKMFKEMDKTKLIQSFAPHIRNMYLIKEGILLCCIGGVEGADVRGDINALLLGDPGVAKTQLLKFMTKIVPKSDYVSGKSASGAGLFGGVDNLPDGTRIGKPGSITMCNGGMAGLDEIEKMGINDRTYCHEVMESQKFSLRKIGIDITWTVKVGIVAAGNPKKSRWNPELTIKENVNIPDSLLSRFGLIFLVRDIPNKSEDLAIAEHIAKVRRGEMEKPMEPEMITKFINYAKTLNPVEDEACATKLTEWWSTLRMEEQKEESIAIDIRTLEDLHRLTEAYARLDLTEVATVDHANRAIKMLNDSLHTLGMNTPGEKNDSLHKSFDKNGYIQFIFSKPISRGMAIAKLCEKPKWFPTEFSAKEEISKLHGKGLILESGDKLSWV